MSPEVIDALVAAGVTAEQLAAAIKADLASEKEARKLDVPWQTLRRLTFERDGHRCQYCASCDGPFHIDHIVPRASGGRNRLENVCVACARCNTSKRHTALDAWMAGR